MRNKDNLRKNDFKLGGLHGRLEATKEKSEASLQRQIFLRQHLLLVNKGRKIRIKLLAYEMPLKYESKRNICVDLVGYDQDYNLYLIELKICGKTSRANSKALVKAEDELEKYSDVVREILNNIEDDFQKTFFLPIKFKNIVKVLLAPEAFYRNLVLTKNDIRYWCIKKKDMPKENKWGDLRIHEREFIFNA